VCVEITTDEGMGRQLPEDGFQVAELVRLIRRNIDGCKYCRLEVGVLPKRIRRMQPGSLVFVWL